MRRDFKPIAVKLTAEQWRRLMALLLWEAERADADPRAKLLARRLRRIVDRIQAQYGYVMAASPRRRKGKR